MLVPQSPVVASHSVATYRGTLISQLKKGLLLEQEKQPDGSEASKKPVGEPSFSQAAPPKQLHRNQNRPGLPDVPWRSSAQARGGLGGGRPEPKAPKKGQSYHSQNRAAGGGRASIGLDDFAAVNPDIPSGPSFHVKQQLPLADAALQQRGRNQTRELDSQGDSCTSEHLVESLRPLPPFITSNHEPSSLVYAPLLSQPGLAKVQVASALEAANEAGGDPAGSLSADRGSHSPVLLPEVNCQTRRSMNLRE